MTPEREANDPHTRGKREMHELAISAFTAIEQVELTELLHAIHGRVLGRSPQDLLDVELIDNVWEWRFKPMIELLLLHIVDVAGSRTMSMAERHNEIMSAVENSGILKSG
jgi:hypothetical protein